MHVVLSAWRPGAEQQSRGAELSHVQQFQQQRGQLIEALQYQRSLWSEDLLLDEDVTECSVVLIRLYQKAAKLHACSLPPLWLLSTLPCLLPVHLQQPPQALCVELSSQLLEQRQLLRPKGRGHRMNCCE